MAEQQVAQLQTPQRYIDELQPQQEQAIYNFVDAYNGQFPSQFSVFSRDQLVDLILGAGPEQRAFWMMRLWEAGPPTNIELGAQAIADFTGTPLEQVMGGPETTQAPPEIAPNQTGQQQQQLDQIQQRPELTHDRTQYMRDPPAPTPTPEEYLGEQRVAGGFDIMGIINELLGVNPANAMGNTPGYPGGGGGAIAPGSGGQAPIPPAPANELIQAGDQLAPQFENRGVGTVYDQQGGWRTEMGVGQTPGALTQSQTPPGTSPPLPTPRPSPPEAHRSPTIHETVIDLTPQAQLEEAPPQAPPQADGQTYTVQRGDSLWRIAEQLLGTGTAYTELARANGMSPDGTIHPGQELIIPGAPPLPEARSGERGPSEGQIVVQRGDSLWRLAEQHLGDGSRWKELADANGLTAQSVIKPNDVLILP